MHGDPPEVIADKIADMRARRDAAGRPPMTFGMAAYAIVRDSEAEAQAELDADHRARPCRAGFANFDQWLSGTQLERELQIQEYSVSNRGLRPSLVGTAEQIRETHRGVRGRRARPPAAADEPAVGRDGAVRRRGDQAAGRGQGLRLNG